MMSYTYSPNTLNSMMSTAKAANSRSLGLAVTFEAATRGKYRQRRPRFSYYPSLKAVTSTVLTLEPGDEFIGGSTNCLVIRVNSPLTVGVYDEQGNVKEFRVNQCLVLDTETAGFIIKTDTPLTNGTQVLQPVEVLLTFSAFDLSIVGATDVLSVNGELPDDFGNVELDVGVLTVNGQPPDADGNAEAVEEAPTDGRPFVRKNGQWVDLNTETDEGVLPG